MRNYRIYFEIFGKRMVTNIEAKNEQDAEYLLRGKINIIEIQDKTSGDQLFNDLFNNFK